MKANLTEPFFKLPIRKTPTWEQVVTVPLITREHIIKVMTGRLPIGLMPFEIITELERIRIVKELLSLPSKFYEDTREDEPIFNLGGKKSFVEFKTLDEFLYAKFNPQFETLTQPLLDRVIKWFEIFGFNVKQLIDPVTLMPYHSKVCRQTKVFDGCFKIDSTNKCTVSHVDDILRDGSKKPDFRIPLGLDGCEYFQSSICVQLETGGYQPDALIIYEQQYSAEMESEFDDWRASENLIKDCRNHFYIPELRQTYLFSTLNIHDVRGGHRLAERLNFSVFFIYVPETNTLYYYN